ncbi:MAG TPA: glycosyl hydrolase [Marinobacter sp.]|uniref:Glycosyl hydrolase n=2 Tax=root TaxID=1 RepID=A0A831R1E0_9GAMM|nr:YCF48-related protein [Marinobacter antarcticus]HDZ37245.1 glycosyl hydrolase [Marinobacter sp.]HEA50817.1 glycosyl hydrolase [Marinobacter antarcticus]
MVGRALGFAAQVAPWAIVSGLAYAAAFVKPGVEPLPLPQPLNEPRDLFYDVAEATGGTFWFAGNNGLILEGGPTIEQWQRHIMPELVNLQGIAASGEGTVLAVGNAGWTFLNSGNDASRKGDSGTRDSGKKEWQSYQLPVSDIAGKLIEATWMDGHFWVIGEMGAIFRTDAKATQWDDLSIEGDVALNDITRSANGDLWITAEFGTLYHSANQGNSWEGRELGYESLRSLAFRGTQGVIVGNGGVIFHTDDSGMTWSEVSSPTSEHLYDVIDDGTRWLATGNGGAVLSSQDGESWTLLAPEGFTDGYHTRMLATPEGVLFAGKSIGLLSSENWASLPDSLMGSL